jgi:hypothetical protein
MSEYEMKEDPNGAEMCRCNNCDSILIDENPRSDAKRYATAYADGCLQQFVDMSDNGVSHDIRYLWGCPNCKTDEYLTDL